MDIAANTETDLNLNLSFRVGAKGRADAHTGVETGGSAQLAGPAGPEAPADGADPAAVSTPGGRPDGTAWLRGVFVPLVTPFTPDASHVDVAALERLAHEVLDDGAAGIVALGTTAEAACLTDDERRTVAAVCARVCAERGVPLVVGVSGNDTRRVADELAALPDLVTAHGTAHGSAHGTAQRTADGAATSLAAALVPVPYFTRPSEDGVVAHFAHLARHSPVPLVVYHIPYRTGRSLSAATLRALAELPGVVGVKHAVGGIDQDAVELLAEPGLPPHFAVLAGDDVFCAALLALGAAGGILASAHVATPVFVEMAAAWERGDTVRARTLGRGLTAVSAALFAEPNPVLVKAVLAAQGRIPSVAVRLPLLPASAAATDRALAALATLKNPRPTDVLYASTGSAVAAQSPPRPHLARRPA